MDPDPGSGAFFPDPVVKNLDPGSVMNILEHISWSLEIIFWVKNT